MLALLPARGGGGVQCVVGKRCSREVICHLLSLVDGVLFYSWFPEGFNHEWGLNFVKRFFILLLVWCSTSVGVIFKIYFEREHQGAPC